MTIISLAPLPPRARYIIYSAISRLKHDVKELSGDIGHDKQLSGLFRSTELPCQEARRPPISIRRLNLSIVVPPKILANDTTPVSSANT